jgi:hypothetical protein
MSLTDRNGGSVYGVAAPATITLCPGATYKELVTFGTTESRLHNWINKSAICSAPAIRSDSSLGYVPEAIFLERPRRYCAKRAMGSFPGNAPSLRIVVLDG